MIYVNDLNGIKCPSMQMFQDMVKWVVENEGHVTSINALFDMNWHVSYETFNSGWRDHTHFEKWIAEWSSTAIKDKETAENPPYLTIGYMGNVDNDQSEPYQEVMSYVETIWEFDASKSIAENAKDAEKAANLYALDI